MPGLKEASSRLARYIELSAAQERILRLLGKEAAPSLVARGVVQRHEPLHSGEPRDCSSLPRSQMATRLGKRRVGVEGRGFDEKNISIFREPNDTFRSKKSAWFSCSLVR